MTSLIVLITHEGTEICSSELAITSANAGNSLTGICFSGAIVGFLDFALPLPLALLPWPLFGLGFGFDFYNYQVNPLHH
jgi:hypothetical protein